MNRDQVDLHGEDNTKISTMYYKAECSFCPLYCGPFNPSARNIIAIQSQEIDDVITFKNLERSEIPRPH